MPAFCSCFFSYSLCLCLLFTFALFICFSHFLSVSIFSFFLYFSLFLSCFEKNAILSPFIENQKYLLSTFHSLLISHTNAINISRHFFIFQFYSSLAPRVSELQVSARTRVTVINLFISIQKECIYHFLLYFHFALLQSIIAYARTRMHICVYACVFLNYIITTTLRKNENTNKTIRDERPVFLYWNFLGFFWDLHHLHTGARIFANSFRY